MEQNNDAIVTQGVNEANHNKSSNKPRKNDLEKCYEEFKIKMTSYAEFNKQCLNKDMEALE